MLSLIYTSKEQFNNNKIGKKYYILRCSVATLLAICNIGICIDEIIVFMK
ncbi:hypothetical protein [Clostridium senegalense]|nr:hypothetical protein [Clostridium senegalense]